MRTLLANYQTFNNRAQLAPVIVVSFEGITDEFFVTGKFLGSTAQHKEFLHDVRINFPGIEISTNDVSRGSANIFFTNSADVINFVRTRLDYGKLVTISTGFREIAIADFVVLFVGGVDSMNFNEGTQLWELTLFDLVNALTRPIFFQQKNTTLAANLNNNAASFNVNSVLGFPEIAALGWDTPWIGRALVSPGVQIEQEIIAYNQTLDSPPRIQNATRGMAFTTPAAHNAGVDVNSLLMFGCSPPQVILYCLINTTAQTAATRTSFYDLGSPQVGGTWWTPLFMDNWMLSGRTVQVDIFSFEKLAWRFYENENEMGPSGIPTGVTVLVYDKESSALSFFSRILSGSSIVLVPFSDSILGPRLKAIAVDFLTVTEQPVVFVFDDNNIILNSARLAPNKQDFYNEFTLFAQYSGRIDDYEQKKTYVQNESVAAYRLASNRLEIISGGMQAIAPTIEALNTQRMRKFLVRNLHLSELSAKIDFSSPWSSLPVEVGDCIEWHYSKLEIPRDTSTNPVRGIVTSQSLSFRSQKISFGVSSFNTFDKFQNQFIPLYTIAKIPEASINKKGATLNATVTPTTGPEDAFYDNTSSHVANVFVVFIRVTPPALPAGQEAVIELMASAIAVGTTFITTHRVRAMHFTAGDPPREFDFYMIAANSFQIASRIKLDFLSSDFTNPPIVELIGVWFVNLAPVYQIKESV